MIPQIVKREIGTVAILDIKGAFTGPWAVKGEELLNRELAACQAKRIVFNMRPTIDLDTLGARSLLNSVPKDKEIGILCGKAGVMDILDRLDLKKSLRHFYDEKELVSSFGESLVETQPEKENRVSPRLQTALAFEFSFEKEGDRFKFRAIVTNLSETGLFAEYIDLETAEESLVRLSPYDWKILQLNLFLPKRKIIHTQAKVVHCRMDGDQVGIGLQFINLATKDQMEIRRFLNINK
jgi:hypothetical protein